MCSLCSTSIVLLCILMCLSHPNKDYLLTYKKEEAKGIGRRAGKKSV